MKFWLPLLVGVTYFITGFLHIQDREYGFALMWLAYGVAQVGILLATKGI